MFIPYGVEVSSARLPLANWLLIATTTFISVVILCGLWTIPQDSDSGELEIGIEVFWAEPQHTIQALAVQPAAFSPAQLLSHLFVHGDLLHLIGNMYFLLLFGNAVNAKIGHAPYVACYLGLGALVALAWLVLVKDHSMVGASGAIMAVVGIFLVLYPRNQVRCLGISGDKFKMVSWLLILFCLGCDILLSFTAGGRALSLAAHLDGALAGTALAICFVIVGWWKPADNEENLLQMMGWQKEQHGEEDCKGHGRNRSPAQLPRRNQT